jgi:hypothetical protein
MKKNIIIAIMFAFGTQPVYAQNTFRQTLPDNISRVRVEGHTRLVISQTDGPIALISDTKEQSATLYNGRLNIEDDKANLTLMLPAGRSMTFEAEDNATLLFKGSFDKRQQLSVSTQDNARATFAGSLADSVWAVSLQLHAEDNSIIHSEVRMLYFNVDYKAEDNAHINMDCVRTKYEPGFESRTQRVGQESNGKVNFNYCEKDSTVSPTVDENGKVVYMVYHPLDKDQAENEQPEKKKSIWRYRDMALNFGWGFHNWGTNPINGFGGVGGPAEVSTSFNNIHLSLNYPLIGTKHFGLYLGLGLEWDKYKFEGNDITFDDSATPHTFADGGDVTCNSWLNTRYVVLPVTFHFDLNHSWYVSLAALPGLHWGSSNTGLHREYNTDLEQRSVSDKLINKYINPYKLDIRFILGYDALGLYLQVPAMSTLRSNSAELYPIKFGLMLKID